MWWVAGLIIALWIAGGQIKGRIRDIPVPIILALYFAVKFKVWWIFPALGASFQVIRCGYGNYDPENDPKPSFLASLTHDRDGWYIRSIWGFLVATIGALPLFIGHFIGWPIYLGYIALNTLINFFVSRFRLPVILTDILVAGGISSIIFLLR